MALGGCSRQCQRAPGSPVATWVRSPGGGSHDLKDGRSHQRQVEAREPLAGQTVPRCPDAGMVIRGSFRWPGCARTYEDGGDMSIDVNLTTVLPHGRPVAWDGW